MVEIGHGDADKVDRRTRLIAAPRLGRVPRILVGGLA